MTRNSHVGCASHTNSEFRCGEQGYGSGFIVGSCRTRVARPAGWWCAKHTLHGYMATISCERYPSWPYRNSESTHTGSWVRFTFVGRKSALHVG